MNEHLFRLVRLLAKLYPSANASYPIAAEMGMDTSSVEFEQPPFQRWYFIVDHCEKAGCIPALLEIAISAFPDNADLRVLRVEMNLSEAIAQPLTPMLVICGDYEFCKDDTAQLIRARIYYRQLELATRRDVEEEIQRRRHDGTLYPWLLVSAHGGPQGIELSDGLAERDWWNRQLEGFQVVMLANCASARTGDLLAGLVDRVVVLYGDRQSTDVSNYVYSFWAEMARTNDADKAYARALREVPAIRPFADIRSR